MRNKLLLALSFVVTLFIAMPACAQTLLSVPVRAAAHEDFDRVVFDWPRTVAFTVHHDGNFAAITFDTSADMKFSRDVQNYITRARGFTTHTDDQGHITVSFAVDPGSAIKAFASGSSIVVDIKGKAVPASTSAPPPSPTPAPAAATTPTAPSPTPGPADASTPPPGTSAPSATPPAPSAPAPTPPSAAALPAPSTPTSGAPKSREPTAAPPAATAIQAPTAKPLATQSAPSPSTALANPLPQIPAAPAADAKATPQSAGAPTASPSPAPLSQMPPEPPPAAPAASPASIAPLIGTKRSSDSFMALSDTPMLVATLDPHVQTRAAIFQRSEIGYVIFDRKLSLAPSALATGAAPLVTIQTIDMPKNSGYRFPVPPNSDLHATMDGTSWKLYLSKKQAVVPVTTALIAQPDFALGARFLLPLPDAPEPIRFNDPVVGDTLVLIPLAQSEAFNAERHMSDLTILPAAQGLVIKPMTDKIIVRAVSDGIEITSEGGLLLSRASDTGASQQSATKARAAAAGKSMFDFATWSGKPGESFTQTRQRLQQTIVDVPDAERNRARLELARFYFANGNGEEALSMLNFLAKQVPDLRVHADFIGLLGASEILAYRAEDGMNDLAAPMLADQPEVDLWEAVGLAQERDWEHAEEKFAIRESMLAGYPEPFFSRFFVLAIEAALATNKDHEAADWLDFVSNSPHAASIDPALSYLRGALHAMAGRAGAAESSWKEAAASHDRLYKVRADLALIDLGVSTASLTPAQAADRLEALRFAWRGDDLEVDILHRLGQFYIEAKNVKAGLNAMSQAVTLYPSSPMTPKIRSEMAKIFHDVFLGDLGKKLSPLDSLTLYQQYRDLMPVGKEGDQVMNNLSERLIAVDLLDQAASLLDDLAKNRLQGEDKDRVALRLAGIRLLDHKPSDAIAALDLTTNDTLALTLQNERVLLRARALSELHRDVEATALLKDNTTDGAKMLRADIARHAQKWGDAAKALMELAGPPPATGKVLTADQAGWLVNAAIAYALDSDQAGLDKLAIDYSAAMASMPQNDTFRMLTQPEKTGQLRDLAAAQAQITQADMFQGFLNNYRTTPAASPSGVKAP